MTLLNGKYNIESIISRGAFGIVYKCNHNNEQFAIKEDKNNILKYEANIYKELRGIKNISQLIDFFKYDDRFFLVLDYFPLKLI